MFFSKNSISDKAELAALNRSQVVIHFAPDGTIVDANENFLHVIGYRLDEIKGQHHRIFCEPTYANSKEYADFWHKLGKGKFIAAQFKRFGKGGKEIWIEASYNPITDNYGKVTGVVKYATDITAQKLSASDAQGQLDAIRKSQAVIEFNLDGTIITANENFLSVTGYTLAEIQGRHHSMFTDPAEAARPEYAAFWQKLGRGEFDANVYRRFAKGGREMWIQASYNPIFDPAGKPYKVVKYASDVTKTIRTIKIAEASVGDLSSVAAAVEEMNSSISEISRNMNMSRQASASILTDSTHSSAAAQLLNDKMKNMKGIIELISGIAEQVNLLALNATIEAARAGDAGKAFAVVAAEVKNLATQTTRATEDISRQIQEVQSSSDDVLHSIGNIASSAGNVDQYVTGAASAIEEQTAVTKEISFNVQKVSGSMQQITDRSARDAA